MPYHGFLKIWGLKPQQYLMTKILMTRRTSQRIKGPLYHITSCFNNSEVPTLPHNWISLIYFDNDCPDILHTGAIADIVTRESPLSEQSDTLAVVINRDSFQYLENLGDLNVEIYDENLGFFENLDYVKMLFLVILSICILFRFIECLKENFLIFLKKSKIKSKKYNSDEELHCTICIEDISKGEYFKELPCTHKFHTKCIDEWLERKEICPNCNAPSDENEPLIST